MIQLILVLLLNLSLHAAEPCVTDPLDPFDPKSQALVATGKYKGKCQDSVHKRTAQLLSQEAAAPFYKTADLTPRSGLIAVANISHNDQFWVALIPVNQAEKMIVQMERFPPKWIAAHTQIRVQFSENSDVILIPQSKKNTNPMIKVKDLVFSSEYNAPADVPYDLFKGLNTQDPHFAINHRVTSLQDKVTKMVIEEKHQVEQFALNLTPAEIKTFFKNWFSRSAKEKMSKMYSTLTCSCTTELYRVIDDYVDYAKRGTKKPRSVGRIPVLVHYDLKSRKLLQEGKKFPDLDIEQGVPLSLARCDKKLTSDYESYGSE